MSWCTHFLLAFGCCYWKVQIYFLHGSYVRKRFFKKTRYFQGFLTTEIALYHQSFEVSKLHLEKLTPSTGFKEDITENSSIKITADTTCPQAQSDIPAHGWSVPRGWLCPPGMEHQLRSPCPQLWQQSPLHWLVSSNMNREQHTQQEWNPKLNTTKAKYSLHIQSFTWEDNRVCIISSSCAVLEGHWGSRQFLGSSLLPEAAAWCSEKLITGMGNPRKQGD